MGRIKTVLADARPPLHLTPVTEDRSVAQDWFERFEGELLRHESRERELLCEAYCDDIGVGD